MTDAFVLGGVRTPVGRYGGSLSHIRTDDLLGRTMVAACERAGVPLGRIEDIAAGCVNVAHEGIGDIARWRALAAVAILRELPNQLDGFQVPDERLSPNGGAVAIGHPFGSSGTRYVLTLATELRERGARYGVLGVCVGSGQGVALVLENPAA